MKLAYTGGVDDGTPGIEIEKLTENMYIFTIPEATEVVDEEGKRYLIQAERIRTAA